MKPIEQSKERYDALKKLLARKDIGTVINACDAGREGELIFTYLYQLTKSKLPVKRAWMQTMTATGSARPSRTCGTARSWPAWRTPPAAAARATG